MKNSEVVNWEELITSNMLQIEAIIRVLEAKGIASSDEILEEVVKLKKEMEDKLKQNQRLN